MDHDLFPIPSIHPSINLYKKPNGLPLAWLLADKSKLKGSRNGFGTLVIFDLLSHDFPGDKTKALTRSPTSIQRFLHGIETSPRRSWLGSCCIILIDIIVDCSSLALFAFLSFLLFTGRGRRNRKVNKFHFDPTILKGSNAILLERLQDRLPRALIHGKGLVRSQQVRRNGPRSKPLKALLFGVLQELFVDRVAKATQIGFDTVNGHDPLRQGAFHLLQGTTANLATGNHISRPRFLLLLPRFLSLLLRRLGKES